MTNILHPAIRVVYLLALTGLWTCRSVEEEIADLIPALNTGQIPSLSDPVLILRGAFAGKKNSGPVKSGNDVKTVLGAKKQNPYAVQNMTLAWNNLYSSKFQKLPVTDLYVRFLPGGLEEYASLDNLDLELLDFPMDYEIVKPGDYYHDPAIPEGEITWLYTVVKPDFVFPDIHFEILAELHLVPYDSYLAAEAFRLAGQPYDYTVLKPGAQTGIETLAPATACQPECPSYPCCLTGWVDCWDDVVPQWCKGLDPDCYPGQPGYPECLKTGGDSPGGGTLINACGCQIPVSARTPAGCIRVVDTDLPANSGINGQDIHTEGVRDVKIVWWNGWFDIRKTYTDHHGCWSLDRSESGRAYMWVKFKSPRKTIRGLRGARFWEYAMAVQDQVFFSGPPYNNLQIYYFPEEDDSSRDKAYWYAATANNALHEYDDFAVADGIPPPPQDLDILMTNYSGSAGTPMFDDLSNNPLLALAAYGTGFVISGALGVGFLPVSVTLAAFWAYIVAFSPDIVYNYGNINGQHSDRLKRTLYHEYGHAAHFAAIHDDAYWLNNMLYTLGNQIQGTNPPYGDGTLPGARRTAVIEMWGNHIGYNYAERTYGVHHSLVVNTDPNIINRNRHIFALEKYDPAAGPGSPNAADPEDAWIPVGLLLDCMDDNELNPAGTTDPVVDLVKGYSMAVCFQAVVTGRECIPCMENVLLQHLPPGQTSADLMLLVSEYGY